MDYLSNNVAVNLKRIRKSKSMSLDQVSEQTGVSKSMLAQIERGTANPSREFDSWISEKSTCRSHKTCFFCVKFLVFIYCILLQCVVKYNKGGILHASYYIEI